MELSERMLLLEKALKPYKKMMGEASDIIREQDVSNYPILVIHQDEVELGIPIYEREKNGGKWSINASSLEEFVSKQLISEDRIEEFKKTYKDPELFICTFIISELGTQFIFMSRIYNYN